MKVSCVFIVLILMTQQISFSQLNVSTGQSPQWYVQNVLLGGGVQISNVTYTGSPNSIGHFTTGSSPTNLGLTEGLILSTGVVNGSPPIGSPVGNFASTDLGLPGSSLLNSLIPGYSTYDAIILEFDFIPLADTIKFRYVFASEEYPEWVGSSYNDVFGFFISGPNPLGGNYNNHNIALIPNTTLPVSINNVNQNSYTQYYVNNQAINGQTIVFDGFTTVLTAKARVVPCQNYHIRIAIADAGDGVYDSAVFLEANSFTSNAINIQVDYNISASLGYAIEGCSNPIISLCLNNPLPNDYTVNVTIGGTATPGVDYQNIPMQFTIPAGQLCTQTTISIFEDNLTEGIETIVLYSNSTICGGLDSVVIQIGDYFPMQVTASPPQTICPYDTAIIFVQVNNGQPPYTYQWNPPLSPTPSNSVSPSQTTTYLFTVTDLCQKNASGAITVIIDSSAVDAGSDVNICLGQTTQLSAINGTSFVWSTGDTTQSIIVSPQSTTTYYVTATGVCHTIDSVTVHVVESADISIQQPNPICKGETIQLTATGAHSYVWSASPPDPSLANQYNLATVTVKPQTTTTYTVTGTNIFNCTATAQTTVIVYPQPEANFHFDIDESSLLFAPTVMFFDISTGNPSQWIWYFDDGTYSTLQNPSHTFPDTITQTYNVTLIVQNEFGCIDSITKPVTIIPEHVIYFPNAFSPENNGTNDYFYIQFSNIQTQDFIIRIFNRWGQMIYESQNPHFKWDGKYNGNIVPPDVYTFVIQFRDPRNFLHEYRGFITVLR